MITAITRLSLLATLSATLFSQQMVMRRPIVSASCTSPTGALFTESFGDSVTSCWTSGPSTCNHTWTATGAGQSIVTSPAGESANTACTNSLQMATGTATKYIQTALSIASAATFTVTFDLYVASTALGAFNGQSLILPSAASDGTGTNACSVEWFSDNGTTVKLSGHGSSNSSNTANVSLNTWHTVVLHCAAGAAASYINIDAGSNLTFTENAAGVSFLNVGDIFGDAEAITYTIGYLKVD